MTEQHTYLPENPVFDKEQAIDSLIMAAGIILIILAIFLLLFFWGRPQLSSQAGTAPMEPSAAPYQEKLYGLEPMQRQIGGTLWSLTPRAEYALSARVLSRKTYFDFQSSLIPLDLALGWGEMADPAIDEWVHWRQSGRWYYYNWPDNSPYGGRAIRDQSANVHIIPASDNLEQALESLAEDDVIYLEGLLVDVSGENGRHSFSLETSLTRTDSGGGACEIFYVEKLIVNGRVYK